MYIPDRFKPNSAPASLLAQLIDEFPFATLISTQGAGDIHISKLPVYLHGDTIFGHISTHNDHCRYIRDKNAVHKLLVDGPHGFISPRFLGNRSDAVPTWNYVTAVVDARMDLIEDKAGISRVLARQLQAYDGQTTSYLDWSGFPTIEQDIMGFTIPVSPEKILLKLKLSQNKSDADFQAIIEHLKKAGQNQLVEWMLRERF